MVVEAKAEKMEQVPAVELVPPTTRALTQVEVEERVVVVQEERVECELAT